MNNKLYWFKKPKDMTGEELFQLPTGPNATREINWTIQEMVAGVTTGKSKFEPVMLETVAVFFDGDDIMSWTDSNGKVWGFGKYKNGAYYKHLLPF